MIPTTSRRTRSAVRRFAGVCLLTLLGTSGAAQAQIEGHPHDLPALTPDAHFPRCTYAELEGIGYPDHKHAWYWRDWEPLVDAEGRAYGPGAFCRNGVVQPFPGLVSGDSVQSLGHFELHHNPGYEACDMLQFLALLDLAGREVPELLGLPLEGVLEVHSPDTVADYRVRSGYDVWRLYRLDGDVCISEPVPVLQARTLDGHAMYAMVCEWLLETHLPGALPPWLKYGLVSYVAEDGVHLVNYMSQFRPLGPILLPPPLIDAVLGDSPDPDPEKDREMYRRATYSAFLMAWELVENQGGLDALRDLLDRMAGGADLDEAARLVYGMGRQDLEAMLDPAALGEPIGKAVQTRSPHTPPE